jgi:hypothetical protein
MQVNIRAKPIAPIPPPFEHGPENEFHGKQGGAGNNSEKQKTNRKIFHS